MTMRYALGHLFRDGKHSLAIMAVTLTLVLLISMLSFIERSQMQQIEDAMDNTQIKAIVSDVYGYQLDDLRMPPVYIDVLSDPNSNISQFIHKLCMKRAIYCRALDDAGDWLPLPDTSKLIGITYLEADPMLLAENGTSVRFYEGYDESVLSGDQMVCLINQAMLEVFGDAKVIRLDFTEELEARRRYIEEMTAEGGVVPGGEDVGVIELTIIGVIEGGLEDAIYCPFSITQGIDSKITGYYLADSMSFTVKDNRRMNELKDFLGGYFDETTPGFAEESSGGTPEMKPVALTIRDGVLTRVVTPLERSVAFLRAIMPVLLTISVGVGFLASYLCIRGRRTEFAMLRTLGTGKGMVFSLVFYEQAMLCLLGLALGVGIMVLLRGVTSGGVIWAILFAVCFLLGSAASIINILRLNIMTTMKTKE